MTNQSNAAAERSAHVERGPRRIPGESFLVEVSPGVFQIKALAEARAEIVQLRAEIVLLEATGAEAADEIERLRGALREIVDRSCETFHINPEGGANISVEGRDRFAFEEDVVALVRLARAALGENGHE